MTTSDNQPPDRDPFNELKDRLAADEPVADQVDAKLLDFAELLTLTPPEALVDGLLYRDTLAVVFGPSGGGKTFLALDLAWCIAGGLPWQGRQVHQGPVLYVCGEGRGGLGQRARAWLTVFGGDHPAGFKLYPDAIDLLDLGQVDALAQWATDHKPVLVVFDTLARSMPGADENTARDMGAALAGADTIRKASGACVLLVHHTGKDGALERGSSALRAAADSVIPVKTTAQRVLTVGGPDTKQKDADPGDEIILELVPVDLADGSSSCILRSFTRAHERTAADRDQTAVRAALTDDFAQTGASRKDLAEHLNMEPTKVSRAANTLLKAGVVINEGSRTRPHFRNVR